MNRGYRAEKSCAPAGYGLGRSGLFKLRVSGVCSPFSGRIAGNDNIGVVAEPLQAAVPNIAMDIIIGARGQPKKFNVPHSSQDEPNDDNAPGKILA